MQSAQERKLFIGGISMLEELYRQFCTRIYLHVLGVLVCSGKDSLVGGRGLFCWIPGPEVDPPVKVHKRGDAAV